MSCPSRPNTDAGPAPRATVVGIGADGWAGLGPASRQALKAAEVVVGGGRHLDLVRDHVAAECVPLPKPIPDALGALIDVLTPRRMCFLGSGDPMFFGIGSTLVRILGSGDVRVLPHVSSVSLACARLGWPVEDLTVVSTVGRPWEVIYPVVQPGRRLLVLTADQTAAARLAKDLRDRGFAPSPMAVLERLGGPNESITAGTAESCPLAEHDRLAIVAVDCRPARDTEPLSVVPGLPDSVYATDGQLSKREIRALTLSALRPLPGQLLWDVGAGTGTVAIEWMRTHPTCTAMAIEASPDRCARISGNAAALGVPGLRVVHGSAPEELSGLARPDAVFVGGAVSVAGVLEQCVAALPHGGRLVANAVTVEAECTLSVHHARWGGELIRVTVQRASALGGLRGWRSAMPVTQWSYTKRESR